MGDSNAARSAVSDSYIKVCNVLWITTRIDRAVDEGTAQKLCGNSFKRQLQSDGAFSSITFVCTGADDILTSNVKGSLNTKAQVEDCSKQIQLLGQKRDKLIVQIDDLKKQKGDCEAKQRDLDKSFDVWDELRDKLAYGPVYRPSQNSKKRKRKTSAGRRRKLRGSVNDLFDSDGSDQSDESDDADDSEDSTDEEGAQTPQEQRKPLTKDDIKAELASLKAQKKQTRSSKKIVSKELAQAKEELAHINDDIAMMDFEKRSLCIQGRGEYVRDGIKGQFAMGLKE